MPWCKSSQPGVHEHDAQKHGGAKGLDAMAALIHHQQDDREASRPIHLLPDTRVSVDCRIARHPYFLLERAEQKRQY